MVFGYGGGGGGDYPEARPPSQNESVVCHVLERGAGRGEDKEARQAEREQGSDENRRCLEREKDERGPPLCRADCPFMLCFVCVVVIWVECGEQRVSPRSYVSVRISVSHLCVESYRAGVVRV